MSTPRKPVNYAISLLTDALKNRRHVSDSAQNLGTKLTPAFREATKEIENAIFVLESYLTDPE